MDILVQVSFVLRGSFDSGFKYADIKSTGIRYIIVTPNQLTATSLVLQYWVDRKKVNPGVWITIFLVTILFINYFGIRLFGEIEFWLSSFKVITIVALIILSLILALGGGPDHDRKGFRYWENPGAFNTYIAEGPKGYVITIPNLSPY
jgi:amino acid transporter